VAEYDALMTRITYWLTLQYALWPILLALFGLVALAWNSSVVTHIVLIWGTGVVAQVIVLHWYHAAREIYDNVLYLENELRGMIQPFVGTEEFCRYDRWLNNRRWKVPIWLESWPAIGLFAFRHRLLTNLLLQLQFESWPAIGSFAFLAVVIWQTHPWTPWDFAGIALNVFLQICIIASTRGLAKRREMFGRDLHSLGSKIPNS
jgi:hypothetical protein